MNESEFNRIVVYSCSEESETNDDNKEASTNNNSNGSPNLEF